jgi:hypothetical protein
MDRRAGREKLKNFEDTFDRDLALKILQSFY